MKKNILLTSLFVVSALFSCTEEKKSQIEVIEEVDGLSLNNGKKWVANKETHKGMIRIKAVLDITDPLTVEDYHLLGGKCDEQTSFIISNCSMKGEEHNQLHFVLHPILSEVVAMIEAKTIEEGAVAVISLNKHIQDYFVFFDIE